MAIELYNIDVDAAQIYQQYAPPPPVPIIPVVEGGAAPVVTINGNSGNVTGPSVTFSGGSTGYAFAGSGNAITLTVANATTVRASIGAAASGANADINTFSALTGSGGWVTWTGTPDKTAHATYSGTASAGYVQAELQGVMDKLKQATEALKALLDTLLASGVIKA
jgi:hypothetical protein